MNILAHCRVYPLSNFFHPPKQFIQIPEKLAKDANRCGEIGLLHLIEHDFKISAFKKQLFLSCKSNNRNAILLIDIVSAWKDILQELGGSEIFVMNSISILNMDGLVNFLLHLNESPLEALNRCQLQAPFDRQLGGIVIDNLSYLAHDATSYTLLIKVLKLLRKTFGCWIITTSYGLEYYNGVENATSHLYKSGSLTRLPISYTSEMDAILIRDTDSQGRLCSTNSNSAK